MRILLGLERPDAGGSLLNGKDYRDLPAPSREVGALLEARAVHTGRSARNHLLAMAATNSIPRARVDEVIGLVGLEDVARKRVGGCSLGIEQRLGVAAEGRTVFVSSLLGCAHTLDQLARSTDARLHTAR
jgi:ABC-2 type transport system ATP-binding protein